jgi:uncharacterized protein
VIVISAEEARTWYEEDDPVHGLDHVLRVLGLALKLGEELGADLEILKTAALLHDAQGAHPGEGEDRLSHEQASALFAAEVLKEKGWDESSIHDVQHCIRTHRFRGSERPQSLEAQILFDADKLDVMGAFGAARTIGYAMQAGQPIYSPVSDQFLETGEPQAGESHSAYHEYIFKLRVVRDRLYTEPARRMAEERQVILETFFEGLAAEAAMSAHVDP